MKQLLLIVLFFITIVASAQNSINWSPGINIASSSYGNLHPRIVTDASGNPMLIWGRVSDASVFFSKWNGTAFTMPMKLNPVSLTIATASWMGPDIATKGDTIYVVMKRTPESSDTCHIYLVHSYDGGMTFSTPVQVDYIADSLSRFPTLAVDDSGNPIVGFMKFNSSFMDSRWVVSKSNDFGNSFSTDVLASGWSGGVVCDCCPGSLVCSGSNVEMLYRDNLNNLRDIWAGRSIDGGNTFYSGFGVDNGNWMIGACPASGPDGAVIGDSLFTVYMSGNTGGSLVYYSVASISSATTVTGNEITGTFVGLNAQYYPRVSSSGNALAVTWNQTVNGTNQLLLAFNNNISTGWPITYDTVHVSNITNSDVALFNGKIFVVWEDDNSGTIKFRSGTYTPITTSINQISSSNVRVFPNPVQQKIHFLNIENNKIRRIDLYNSFGKVVSEIKNENSTLIDLDVSGYSNGIYFLKLFSNDQMRVIKIVKQ